MLTASGVESNSVTTGTYSLTGTQSKTTDIHDDGSNGTFSHGVDASETVENELSEVGSQTASGRTGTFGT